MSEFQYDYVKPKNCEKAKLFYMDTDSSIVQIKTDDIYKTLQKMLKLNLIAKRWFREEIMTKYVRLRAKNLQLLN